MSVQTAEILIHLVPDSAHEIFSDLMLIFGLIIASVTVLKFPYRRFMSWLRGNRTAHEQANDILFHQIPGIVEALARLEGTALMMEQELHPNHGTSMRDAINRIEDELLYNRATFQAYLAHEDSAIFITDKNADLIWTNESFRELVNRDTTELIGQGYWNIIEPAELDSVRKLQIAARADKRDLLVYFNVATGDPDFPLVPVKATAQPLMDRNGVLQGYLGVLRRLDGHEDTVQ